MTNQRNPETIAALRRKIQRLEAQVQALKQAKDNDRQITRDLLYDSVDRKIRIKQAVRILTGEDE